MALCFVWLMAVRNEKQNCLLVSGLNHRFSHEVDSITEAASSSSSAELELSTTKCIAVASRRLPSSLLSLLAKASNDKRPSRSNFLSRK